MAAPPSAQEPVAGAAPSTAVGGLGPALLATKLYLPPPRSGVLARPRLLERLAAGLAGPLTLVTAPAGYGKTTLVGAWRAAAAAAAPPFAWVALDDGDNDAGRFWS